MIILGLLLGVPQIDDESGQLYLYAGIVVLGTLALTLLACSALDWAAYSAFVASLSWR